MAKKIGCEDCGGVYARKSDVPVECRPYCGYVVKDETCIGGYAFTNDEDPTWGAS